jgi:hypothetical protein
VDRRAAERWKNRLGGTVLFSGLLLFPAVRMCLDSTRVSLWAVLLVIPAGALVCGLVELTLGRPYQALSRRLTAWAIRPGARHYVEVLRWRGVPLLAHWSFFAFPAALLPSVMIWPAAGGALVAASVLVVLIHELGHAAAARGRGCHVDCIALFAVHGQTTYSVPSTERDAIVIAWGGVLAQLAVAVPACGLLLWRPRLGIPAEIFLFGVGPWSLLMAGINLLPLAGLDGAMAWRFLRRKPRWGPTVVRFPRRSPLK